MNHRKQGFVSMIVVCCMILGISMSASAASVSVDCTASYAFSAQDFFGADEAADGIYLMEVPKSYQAELCLGSRTMQTGDVLPTSALAYLKLVPTCTAEAECSLVFAPIQNGVLQDAQTMTLRILSGHNTAPECQDSTLQTYKNISNSGKLKADDAQNEAMTYQLVKGPKRGAVELHEDGTFTYTPDHNKVGKDRFVFTATDAAGNISEEAEVRIQILKPLDQATYRDMADSEDAFAAMWLKEQGIYEGRAVADQLLFEPNREITRGEFLVMAMSMASILPDDSGLESTFDDAVQIAQWQEPYVVSAYQKGLVSGTEAGDTLVFCPNNTLTNAEAAVILQKVCGIPDGEMAVFMENTDIPVWAQGAILTLSTSDITIPSGTVQNLTMRDAAIALYDCAMYLQNNTK